MTPTLQDMYTQQMDANGRTEDTTMRNAAHTHTWTRGRSSTIETCSCGRWRHVITADTVIVTEQPAAVCGACQQDPTRIPFCCRRQIDETDERSWGEGDGSGPEGDPSNG